MSTVFGKIRTLETNKPMGDLIVSLHAGTTKGMPPRERRGQIKDPFKFFNKHLGATITTESGEFQIQLNEKSSSHATLQKEPHEYILAVLSPSMAKTPTSTAATLSSRRLLHWTQLPHITLGKTEACVIQIPIEKAKALNVPLFMPESVQGKMHEIKELLQATDDWENYRTAVNKRMAPYRARKKARAAKLRDKSAKLVAKLGGASKQRRSMANWVDDVSQQEGIHKKIIAASLQRFKEDSSTARQQLAVNLTVDQLQFLGIASAHFIEHDLEVDQDMMCRLLNQRRGGNDMTRVRTLLDACRQADQAVDDSSEEAIPDDTPSDTTVDTTDMPLAVRAKILGQLKDMPSGDDTLVTEKTRQLTREELSAMLPSVRLGSGPSDTPAFHDFHNLQIAFDHVWTEAFDHELKSQVQELYEKYAELHEEQGEGFPTLQEFEEIQDVKRFLEELGRDDPFISSSYSYNSSMKECIQSLGYPLKALKYVHMQQRRELQRTITEWWSVYKEDPSNRQAKLAMDQVRHILENPIGVRTRLERLLYEISRRLNEPYAFHYFAPDSVNFGIMTTYRQHWVPGAYQVGDLVSTIPLAPGEKRQYKLSHTVKKSRAETELDKAMHSLSREVTSTRRVEAEITQRASMRTNFQMTSQGSFRFAIGEISAGSQFSMEQAKESSAIKKDFREAVLKAAQEYRQEHSLQIQTVNESTYESSSSGELSNPNNELTVTYLLYELERQYKISERINRVTPVVLVAQDVPGPHEITEGWLLAHEWILKRVLLDDSMLPALDYLTNAFAGEELSVSIKKENWKTQIEVVEKLQLMVNDLLSARSRFRMQLISTEESKARLQAAEDAQGWLSDFFENLTVGDLGEMAVDQAEASVNSLKKQLEYLEEGLKEKQEELALGKEAMEAATDAYTEALELQTNRRVAIDQLRIHVKDNILYYMQAIWDHEPPDQRFFRLYHVEVDLPESSTRTCTLRRATTEDRESGMPLVRRNGQSFIIENCAPPSLPEEGSTNRKKLVEIADLDKPLGYKGNYMIFPMKECLYLTNYMMREFFDDYFGVRDPELAANYSVEELETYTRHLVNDPENPLTEAERDALNELIMDKLQQPRRDSDLVVVPTGELFMEALMGDHALLEKYKLNHRFFDMAKARAEWREHELENLRKAARMLKETPDYADPDVDRHIVMEGVEKIEVDATT